MAGRWSTARLPLLPSQAFDHARQHHARIATLPATSSPLPALRPLAAEPQDASGSIEGRVLRLCGLPTAHLYRHVLLLSCPNKVLETMAEKQGYKKAIAPKSNGEFFGGFHAGQFLRGAPLETFYVEEPPLKVSGRESLYVM